MGNDTPGKERRRTQRVRWALMLKLQWKGGKTTAYTTEISGNGFFAETREEIPEGTELTVLFNVPGVNGGQSVEATARVVHQIGPEDAAGRGLLPGVGVRFKRIRGGQKAFRRALDSKHGRLKESDENRRSQPRLPVGMPITWDIEDPPGKEGRMVDISAEGALCVVMEEPPSVGTRIYLAFKLPDEGVVKDVKALARVVRTEVLDGAMTMGIKVEASSVGENLMELLEKRLPEVAKEIEPGLLAMDVKDAAQSIKQNIPRIKLGDKYHVFRWWWVMSWFGGFVVLYALLYFALGSGACN